MSIITLAIETVIISVLLFALQAVLLKSGHNRICQVLFGLKILLVVTAAFFFMAVEWKFSYTHGDILTALYLALFGDVLGSAAEFVICRIADKVSHSEKSRRFRLVLNAALTALFTVGYMTAGYVNFSHISEVKFEIETEGLSQEHRFAFVSDIHAENSQRLSAVRDMVEQINSEQPEFVVLGGDLTDELTPHDVMTALYEVLSEIEAPVYFIYGNHDRQPGADLAGSETYSDEDLVRAVCDAGITVLSDEYVQISDDLVLLGREDISAAEDRKDFAELQCPYSGALLVADHQPFDETQLESALPFVQISGHTHAGQLFPLKAVYRLGGVRPYGYYEEGSSKLYVSSGAGTWSTPIRTEERCEWIMLTLNKSDIE